MEKTQTKQLDRDLNISSRRYILISPCRNEAPYIQITIHSVVAQTIRPTKWLVVDDNSTDETPELLAEAASKYPFIEVIRRDRSGGRKVGPAVIEAFYTGFQTINPNDYDYICKFDMDLDIPSNYFELLMQRMEANPRIGTCSGKPYFRDKQGRLISEKCGDETSVGMTKFYRVECFQQIGGFVREVMWDGIDCHRCRMYGWIACSWDDPKLRFIHLRPMGSSQKGMLIGRMRHGFGQYFMGTGLLYMIFSAFYRMTRPPIIIGGFFMLIGYLKSMLLRHQRYDDLEFRKFLRRYQWNCLLKGKARATQELNRCQAKKWMQLQ
ncbi:glycosyltransferase [Pleurocapsales cyanobacterium LEGE 06147]|nr:glycosyltransferase [Pleurocapsales cyanobacterium LEGE 06147]